MFSAIVIGAGAALGAGASIYAADKQAGAAGDAAKLANSNYLQTRSDLGPWKTTGVAANSKLAQLLGIGVDQGNASVKAAYDKKVADFDAAHKARYGVSIWDPTADAASRDRALAQFQAETQGQGPTSADYGSLLKTFSPGDLTQDPGYQFGLTQGEKALNRSAASNGMYFSPATSQALSTFNQDYAGTKYNDAFARDQASKSQTYGFLSGTSGAGENAAGQVANLGAQNASNVGSLLTSGAAASGAGAVGASNAVTGATGNYLNYTNQSRLIDLLNSNRSATTNYVPNQG